MLYYYAHLNSSNLVDAVYAFETQTTEEGYIEITEAQYELPIIEYRYYPETGYFERWYWSCTTDDIKYPGTITMITTILDDLQDGLDDKADADHDHDDDYAAVDHTHSNYATTNHSHSNYSLTTHTHTASEVGAATSDHTHSNYASSSHNHDSAYSAIGHDHDDDYADIDHTHSNYATTTALNELATTVSGKANTTHSHNDVYYTETEVDTKLSAKASASHSHNDVYYTETEVDSKLSAKANTSHTHTISDVTNLQSTLNGKAATSHKHYSTAINYTGEDLNNYTDAGTYTFTNGAAVSNAPAGTNGWLVVMPWEEGSATIKQLWFRHGTVGSNDFETYVRTKIGSNSWGSWSKYYTTSNPPTFSEVGASPAFTASNGGVILSYTTADGINLLDKIEALSVGVYTIYSQAAVTGNPNTTEAWRFLVHKTNGSYGWVQGYGSYGSVYTNYLNGSGGWKGWKCVWDASPAPLWTGAKYMTSTDGTPQVVTPSKKLSECQHGWLLLWSDYDPGDGANDIDFVTTMIPKRNATGGTWGGKAFLCDIPRYIGSDTTDTSTEKRIMKVVYVHDDCIKGSYQNASGDRNDVVLRAVYEF